MFGDGVTSKKYNLEQRLKLFKAVVQPSLLYGCCCWTLTLKTTQRKMMRTILGVKRRITRNTLESWIDWMIRATHEGDAAMRQFNVPDWVEEVHRRKFRWAGHVSRRHDGRWTREVLTWMTEGSRARGRPVTRWADSINQFFKIF